jgi:HK97 gp10 family phage protein
MPAVIAGMDKLIRQLNEVGLAFTLDDLAEGALVIAEAAENMCPVGETGNLKASIFVRYVSNNVEVGFSESYASYVEFGTYKMAAQPYLRPAVDFFQEEALSAIVDSVTANMRDITR